MNLLVIDVGGTHVKVLLSGEHEPRRFESGPKLTAREMVAGVKQITGDWKYDAVSIGFPVRYSGIGLLRNHATSAGDGLVLTSNPLSAVP